MIDLKNVITDIKKIDPAWTFSHYCNVPIEYFNGSTIKIKSIFKPDEKTPSLCFYFKKNVYKFNCFSTSQKGDHVNFVQVKYNLSLGESCSKIIKDYTNWVLSGKVSSTGRITTIVNYKINGFVTRQWNTLDKAFWTSFNIGSTLLNWGLVKPLDKYKMSNGSSEFIIAGDHLYGYFTKEGKLYKIYQPKKPDCKFISVDNTYVIGSDHKKGSLYYGILSSWKDAMSFESLGLSIDLKVPPSENTYFSKEYIRQLNREYKGGFSLLDNDEAGIKAMKHYQQNHKLNYVYLPLSNDLSDSIRDHGAQKVTNIVVPLIHKALNK